MTLGMPQHVGERRESARIEIGAEDEFDDRCHRRTRLGLDARFVEQLGIIVGIPGGRDRKVVRQRERFVERGAGAAFTELDRFGRLASGPQPVGQPR